MKGTVQFGVALRNFAPVSELLNIEEVLSYAELAEKLEFDSVWVWDHILLGTKRPFPFLESLSVLAAVAVRTRRVRLGTGVLVLPLRNPVVLAKVAATLDHLSGGRLILGLAVGWYRKEFLACGVPYRKRGRLFLQHVKIMDRLWREEVLTGTFDGYVFEEAVMLPKPLQRPRPPLYFGGYVERVLRRVAENADGWITYFYTAESFQRSWEKIRRYAEAAGRNPNDLSSINQLPICVAKSFEEADRRVRDFVGRYFDIAPWSESTLESAIRGTPEQCAEQLARHLEAGVRHIVLVPADYATEQLEAIAGEVLPRLRSASDGH